MYEFLHSVEYRGNVGVIRGNLVTRVTFLGTAKGRCPGGDYLGNLG
jgi:hypothetical protein